MKKSNIKPFAIRFLIVFVIFFFVSKLKGGFNRTISPPISLREMIPYIPLIAVNSFLLVWIYYRFRNREDQKPDEKK